MSPHPETHCGSKKEGSPGFNSPQDAVIHGKREHILYVSCISTVDEKGDYISVVDVDEKSRTFCQVISRMHFPVQTPKDELHHFGWNVCSSCCKTNVKRDKLIFPCLNSDRIYVVDVSDEKHPKLHKTIEPEELHRLNLSAPHTTHCLPSGEIMISTMGDGVEGNAKGSFLILDSNEDFKVKGTWNETTTQYGYDFWYQPKFDVMISSEWGAPKAFKLGLNPAVLAENYGHFLNVWRWSDKKLMDKIDLGDNGWLPLEIRFLHDPLKALGFVGCALSSTIFRFHQTDDKKWAAQKLIQVPSKTVENWWVGLTEMPGVITDIIISMDDKYLYFSNWVHGDVRQYDISNPECPKLTGQVFVGGSIVKGGPVVVVKDAELSEQPEPLEVKGVIIPGGPQMLQLSLDGKRLYLTTSLFSPWDKQFYPDMAKKGACLLQIDVDIENGGMKVNKDFLVDFRQEGCLAHEMRYPGGDCTSDIFMPC